MSILNRLRDDLLPLIRQYWQWAVRLALLWGIVSALAPEGARVMLPPPQTVQAEHEHVCVHTRLMDEVEEWVIQRSLALVREMGAETIVEFMPWAYMEPHPDQYDWRQADMIIRHAQNQGIQVIARLGFVPAWARPDDKRDSTTLNYLSDEAYEDFADFVRVFAERYAGQIDHIIIWNEPNLAFEWGYQEIDPAAYVRLLAAVHPVAKAANPNITILGGALAPTLEPPGSPHGLNDLIYLEAMYEAGAADYMDALAVHTYGFTNEPDQAPAADRLNFRRAELLYEVVQRYDPETPVYITESGWNDHPRWTQAVRPSLRVQYTVEAFDYVEQHWPWTRELCIWAFRYPAPTYSYPDNFTLVKVDFQRKPIYYALRAYARSQARPSDLWLPPPTADDSEGAS